MEDRQGEKLDGKRNGKWQGGKMTAWAGKTLLRKAGRPVMQEREEAGVPFLTFPSLDGVPFLVHGLSTRQGGVSRGEFATMNFSFSRGDDRERVLENYRRMAAALGVSETRMVCSSQTHTTNIRNVTEKDCGKGILYERDYTDVDGLITEEPDVILTAFFADCVPLFFADIKRRAVGLAHSGWRGTVNDIAGATVRAMHETFGTDPEDLLAAIGPSICQDCYEVSEDVIGSFQERYEKEEWGILFYPKENGKYQLNLWEACRLNLLHAGIRPDRIEVTDVCTCCNPQILFSHRASRGRRGNLAAFLGVRKS